MQVNFIWINRGQSWHELLTDDCTHSTSMKNSIVLELRFSAASQQLLSYYGDAVNPETEYIFQLINIIDERIGGMLCFEHFGLPDARSSFMDRQWAINITCCCEKHAQLVEDRLKTIFPESWHIQVFACISILNIVYTPVHGGYFFVRVCIGEPADDRLSRSLTESLSQPGIIDQFFKAR